MRVAFLSAVAFIFLAGPSLVSGVWRSETASPAPAIASIETVIEQAEDESMLGWIYAKAGAAGVNVEVKSIGGTPICGELDTMWRT